MKYIITNTKSNLQKVINLDDYNDSSKFLIFKFYNDSKDYTITKFN